MYQTSRRLIDRRLLVNTARLPLLFCTTAYTTIEFWRSCKSSWSVQSIAAMARVATIRDMRVNPKCKAFSSCRFQSSKRALTNVSDGFACVAERDFKLQVYLATRTCAVSTLSVATVRRQITLIPCRQQLLLTRQVHDENSLNLFETNPYQSSVPTCDIAIAGIG